MSQERISSTNLHEGTIAYDEALARDEISLNTEMQRQHLLAETRRRIYGILDDAVALTGNRPLSNEQDVVLGGERRRIQVAARSGLSSGSGYSKADFARIQVIDPDNGHIVNDLNLERGHNGTVTAEYCDYNYEGTSQTGSHNWRKAPGSSNRFTPEAAAEGIPELPEVADAVRLARQKADARQAEALAA